MTFHHYRRSFFGILALCAALSVAATAWAVVTPAEGQRSFEIPLKEFDLHNYSSPAVALARTEAASSFAASLGGHWSVYSWNPQTNTPHFLYGSGVDIASPLRSDDQAAAAGLDVVRAARSALKADPADLRFDQAPAGNGKRSVLYQQTYRGVDVYGGGVKLVFMENGRLFVAGSDFYPNISVDPNPSFPARAAQEIAARDLPFDPATDEIKDEATLLVLPVPVSATEVEYHLVWRVKVFTQEPLGEWVTHVDAHSGQILWRYNDICFTDFTGTAHGMIQDPSYCEGQSLEAMPYLRVQVSGVGNANADVDGNWTLPYGGTDPHTVTADLYSDYVDLYNQAGTQGTFTGTATPGVPLDVYFDDLNSQRDEKDVYVAVNQIHIFYEDIDPNYVYTNRRMPANVRVSGTCNAYWYNDTINFYGAGGGCANTGEIMGVVQHEFCHGITNNLIGSQGSQGIGEGNSDILSNLMTMESIIGRGFYLDNCTSGIRNSDNNLVYPDDVIGQEIHFAGQVIAGFHWDSMQELIAAYGIDEGRHITTMTWHFGRVHLHPTTQPDQVFATFVEDDDDGNLDNGTPHHEMFSVGALNHGFTPPPILTGVFIVHEPLSSRTIPGSAEVVAEIYSTEGALVADSLRLNWRRNGGEFTSVLLEPTGNENEYAATIDGLVTGDEVEYYLHATDIYGNAKSAPEDAPETLYPFDIATLIEPFETASDWTVDPDGTDTATTGIWVQVDPNGTIYNGHTIQPEDDHTAAPGTQCWVTGQGSVGGAAGEEDVDGGATTLLSSVYDLSGSPVAKVKYWLWYTDNLGINAGDDTWRVQVRNNGGTWMDLENTTESPNTWVFRSFDLAALFGTDLGNVQLKFIASDTGQNSLLEALIDDFEVLTGSPVSVPADGSGPARFAFYGARPNPARDGAAVSFQVPRTTSVRVSVYNVSGRLVRTIADRPFAAGVHSLTWDGRDGSGHQAASGVYYVRMQAGEFGASRTLVLTR